MWKLGRKNSVPAASVPAEAPAVSVDELGIVHTPRLDRERASNLVEVSRILTDAPALASLALKEAEQISVERHLPFDEILASIPDPRTQSQAS